MQYTISIEVMDSLGEGSVTVTKAADGTVTIKPAAPGGASIDGHGGGGSPLPVEVEAMVVRHEANGHPGTRSRELAHALVDRGWVAKAGPKYLRFIYTGSERKVTLYANSRDIMTRNLPEFVQMLPGAIPAKNEVRFRYAGDNFEEALDAAEFLKSHGDSVDPEPEGDEAE